MTRATPGVAAHHEVDGMLAIQCRVKRRLDVSGLEGGVGNQEVEVRRHIGVCLAQMKFRDRRQESRLAHTAVGAA